MTAEVAVVIPAFNHARHLADAIDSVLEQDYPHINLIVIDDGSTDDTRRVLERCGSRLRWHSRENRGQSATLNEGWSTTRGDILLYLGDDDRLLPGAVSTAVVALRDHPDAIGVYGDYHLIDARSTVLRRVPMPAIDIERMLREFATPAAGVFIRRRVWEQVGGWDASLHQLPDFDFFIRALRHGPLLQVNTPLAEFRVHDGSQTFKPVSASRAAEPIVVVDRLFAGSDVPAHLRHLEGPVRAMARVVAARYALRRSDWLAAVRQLASAVGVHPPIVLVARAWRLVVNGLMRR